MKLRQAVGRSRPPAVAAPLQGRPAAAGTAYHQLATCLLAFVSVLLWQRPLVSMLGSAVESPDRRSNASGWRAHRLQLLIVGTLERLPQLC